MNLVSDPWIPVTDRKHNFQRVSLEQLFQRAAEIGDLAVNPAQRIALMRLLICITQAALNGPRNEGQWLDCQQAIPAEAKDYLAKWQPAFGLFGRQPFMQVPDLECKDKGLRVIRALDWRSPFGGSATVHFARDIGYASMMPEPAQSALDLLCLLNFSPGGKVGQAVWHGKDFSSSTFQAPNLNILHTFVKGQDLLETIWLNLICKEGPASLESLPQAEWGKPTWELFPAGPDDEKAISNATSSYLGRLVPLTRLVRILDGQDRCIVGPPPKALKPRPLPAFRDPFATVVASKKDCDYLKVSSSKHIWRELGSILSLSKVNGLQKAALPLARIRRLKEASGLNTIEIWTGGLETGATAAKLNDLLEWNLTLPPAQFEQSALARYQAGVELAERADKVLRAAVKKYWKGFNRDGKTIPYDRASGRFWSDLDAGFNLLVETASAPEASLNESWYPRVRRAMENAFGASCPHVAARQIQVFAEARTGLRLKKLAE